MKKLLSIAVALMFITSMAIAQGPSTKPAASKTTTTSTSTATKKDCSTKSCCSHGDKKACNSKKTEASATSTKPSGTNQAVK